MPVDPRIQAAIDAPLRGVSNVPKFKRREGYAFAPGSGPEGETCRTCHNSVPNDCSRRYWKCALVKWTKSQRTDIALRTPACAGWEAKRA